MALPTFYDLDGKPLEIWFQNFFSTSLVFSEYFPSSGQIELTQLNPTLIKGHNLELDGILRLHKTGVIFEFTAENGKFRDKIRKFLRNVQIFTQDQTLSLREKFKLFGVPSELLDDFEEIENWKFVFFGTCLDFDNKNYSQADFLDYPDVMQELYLIKPSQLEYLRQLTNSIGAFAKNELLAMLEFVPTDLGEGEETFSLDFIKADGKYISSNDNGKTDVYLLKFKIQQLLNIARVSRYEGLPLALEGGGKKDMYQRLLIDPKLENIATEFISNNKNKTFPNTITLAISSDCKEVDGKLVIPKKYSSIDIIDGQHRLFGYTRPEVSDEVREKGEILATAIRFRETDDEQMTKHAARVFCEINSTQATVSKDLLYLIKYDVLGDKDDGAVAGKVILECDRSSAILNGIFAVNTLRNKNGLNKPTIRIVHLIETEIIPFMKGYGLEGLSLSENDYEQIFGFRSTEESPADLIKKASNLISEFFSYVSKSFSNDWKVNAETSMISEFHFAGLIKFFRHLLFDERKSMVEIKEILQSVKDNIHTILESDLNPCFPIKHSRIPGALSTPEEVFYFLKEMSLMKQASEIN